MRWPPVLGVVAAIALAAAPAAGAAGLRSASPLWWEDSYTDTTGVAAATAVVDPAGGGSVRLPYAPASLDFPPGSGEPVLLATQAGVQAWAWNGEGFVAAPAWDIASGRGTEAVAWVGMGARAAVLAAGVVAIYGWTGSVWARLDRVAVPGARYLAASASGRIVVVVPPALDVFAWDGLQLRLVHRQTVGQGIAGVAADATGAAVAVWSAAAVHLFAWDGSAYREVPAWEPGGPPGAVAFFRGGYWVQTGGGLQAYAFTPAGVMRWPSADVAALAAGAILPAAEPGQRAVAVLYPWGWAAYAWDGAALREDAAREVHGLALPAYRMSAMLRSVVIAADHTVSQLRVEPAADLPRGTSLTWEVSTDGGVRWEPIVPFSNLTVPPGRSIVYRVGLYTRDPARTPVLEQTDLYEIAVEVIRRENARAVLIR